MPSKQNEQLRFLDGMRGLAALYVACFHAATVAPQAHLSRIATTIERLFVQGHFAVSFFIVISGYCLMLPVASAENHRLRGGLKQFVVRRSRRILPPYYAALIASLPVSLFYKHLKHARLSAGSLISHLVLLHNLKWSWADDINGVFWTIATEWQIYFIFAIVLLPVFRRAGMGVALLLSVAIGLSPYLSGLGNGLFQAAFWYVGLFSFGMTAAVLRTGVQHPRARPSYLAGSLTLFAAVLIAFAYYQNTWWQMIAIDNVLGVGVALFICYCAVPGAAETPIVRILSSQLLVGLGLFSYSLYLIHFPIIATCDWFMKRIHFSDNQLFAAQLVVVIPVCIAMAYVFFLLFERPFLSKGKHAKPQLITPDAIAAP